MGEPNHRIVVCDVVNDTITNAGGLALYHAMVDALNTHNLTELSFQGAGGMSTSFLNSSFGAIVEERGIQILKKFRPVHLSRVQMDMLKRYLQNIKEHQA